MDYDGGVFAGDGYSFCAELNLAYLISILFPGWKRVSIILGGDDDAFGQPAQFCGGPG